MSLYSHRQARDNCGFGLIAQMQGQASHTIVKTAIHGLAAMQHRGGVAADGKTGDGCGLLLKLPEDFFRAQAAAAGWQLGKKFAIGMLFLATDKQLAAQQRQVLTQELQRETLTVEGWREVPTDVLGTIGYPIAAAN